MYKKYKNVEHVKPSGLDLKDHLVGVQRVTKVTKGGRTFGFTAIVVVGDGVDIVGHGLGKSKDVATAIAKAIDNAKKNLVRIPIINKTIPHEQKTSYYTKYKPKYVKLFQLGISDFPHLVYLW